MLNIFALCVTARWGCALLCHTLLSDSREPLTAGHGCVQMDRPVLCVFWLQMLVKALQDATVKEVYWPLQLTLTYLWRNTWAVRLYVCLLKL